MSVNVFTNLFRRFIKLKQIRIILIIHLLDLLQGKKNLLGNLFVVWFWKNVQITIKCKYSFKS